MSGPVAVLLVAVGGALGAVTRHLVDQLVTRVTPGDYPWGILLVNAVGSFVLGWTAAAAPASGAGGSALPSLLIGTGFCGALTTYSTVAASTWAFAGQGRRGRAVVVITATVLVASACAALGGVLGTALAGPTA